MLQLLRRFSKKPRIESPTVDLPDLSWVSEWIARVKDYIHVRPEDNVFIQRPNKAFKLNPQGVALMAKLLDGMPIDRVLEPYGDNVQAWRDTERFLLDLRQMLKQGIDDTYESPAVEKEPFVKEFSDLPVLSEVAVTYRCNAKCEFCYAGCNCTTNPVGNDREMTLDEVKKVLDKIRNEAKVPSVSFTGGEATLRKDLPDMIRHARSLGMRVNLITNGILSTQEKVDELVAAGLHSVQVSIEGTEARTHDLIVQIPGSFEKATGAVHRYRDAGITVHTNTTINQRNLHDVARFPKFVKEELGLAMFSMNLVIPTGSASVDAEHHDALAVTYVELAPVLEHVLEESNKAGIEFKWYSPTPMCIFNPILHGLGNKGCSACDGLVSVGADGQILPCASYDEPVGSLLDHSFENVWHNDRATAYRSKDLAHDVCKTCDNFDICHGACPLYWRKMGFDELLEVQGLQPQGVQPKGGFAV